MSKRRYMEDKYLFRIYLLMLIGLCIFTGIALEKNRTNNLLTPVTPTNGEEFFNNAPLALRKREYWGKNFAIESWSMPKYMELETEKGYWYFGDFSGAYFNVKNKFRFTVGQPSQYVHTLWLTGSSTVFDLLVPDKYTLASYLQLMAPPSWRVVNAGLISNIIVNERERIGELPVISGDIVIWMGGAWDTFKIYEKIDSTPDCNMASMTAIDIGIKNSLIIQEMRDKLKRKNVTLYYVIEPVFFSGGGGLPLDKEILDIPESKRYLDSCYLSVTSNYFNALKAQAADFRSIFDDLRRQGVLIFGDIVHRTDVGSPILAQNLAELIGWVLQ